MGLSDAFIIGYLTGVIIVTVIICGVAVGRAAMAAFDRWVKWLGSRP